MFTKSATDRSSTVFTNSATDQVPCSQSPPLIQHRIHKFRQWSSTMLTKSATDPAPCSQIPPLIQYHVHKVRHCSSTVFTKSSPGLTKSATVPVPCSQITPLFRYRVHKVQCCTHKVRNWSQFWTKYSNSKAVSFCRYTQALSCRPTTQHTACLLNAPTASETSSMHLCHLN